MNNTTVKSLIVAAAAVLAVGACGSSNGDEAKPAKEAKPAATPAATATAEEIDYEEWEQELSDWAGHPIWDFDTVVEITEEYCAKTDDRYELWVAINIDDGMGEGIRINTKYACPDKLPIVEEMLATYQ